ncbi:hypothetical protein HK104_006656 [Borealophlyctis nickersoniae]|nr:hypothetical protein HK104_006656 [Borealophlyctis nickersoniae]
MEMERKAAELEEERERAIAQYEQKKRALEDSDDEADHHQNRRRQSGGSEGGKHQDKRRKGATTSDENVPDTLTHSPTAASETTPQFEPPQPVPSSSSADKSAPNISAVLGDNPNRITAADRQLVQDFLMGRYTTNAPTKVVTVGGTISIIQLNARYLPSRHPFVVVEIVSERRSRRDLSIYFSNSDFLWSNDYPVNRYAQGAFREALEHLYKQLTGLDLQYTKYGKPEHATYRWVPLEHTGTIFDDPGLTE